ncbi:influenza virus NS1A-binding protein-like isoform X1 [Diorhabda sublineata]|uniref:influenza virus NS1A-binding protein-like isoform X1 n=2 Tax=Diorhabda sublineata TaxID=1163346 RepID=UPI0024E0E9E9|nr:influenza virus NS1A-binding protein-like isoform X1 [Diorhabda sublineata]XP_056640303.1 influenza virus NS1A-binding protein-like isoform X1 [Diorhabda sublineata]XP_056640304.1 influenza virus NS1A-binding protein-like isoform X1 [Diorhabda sublineata]
MSLTAVNGTPKQPQRNEESQEIEEEEEEDTIHLEYFDEALQVHLLKSLNMMRKNRHFCDVILYVGNTELHAHRSVLASVSPYLFELFSADQEQKRTENVITYKLNGGFNTSALQILIDYAYTGKLQVTYKNVKAVFLCANNLKMERVTKICGQHLIKHLSVENCIEIRSLPGIARNKEFIQQVDTYIAKEFPAICKTSNILNLNCARIEVLNQSKEEMSLVNQNSLCRLVLEWVKRQLSEESLKFSDLMEKTFMLYLALDNSLQDCSSLPSGDISDTEMVQDYKKLSLKVKQGVSKPKRKVLGQPLKPRVLIYNREIGEELENELEPDWNLIGVTSVGEHSFLALMTLGGKLSTLSVQLKLNTPSTPSPVLTPDVSRSTSEEKPDLYCAIANMSCHRCALGCGNFNNTLIVCGGYDRTECLKSVEQYIPETNTWKTLPQMRENRGRFKIAVLDDKIYAIGGSNGTTELDSVEMLDMSIGKWVKMPKMPLARSNMGVCTLDKKIYCIGGWNGQVGIKQCHVYDPETAAWTPIANLNAGRYQAGVTAYNNLVYAIGGSDAWNCLSSVEYYNPEDDTWNISKPIITARRGCGLSVFNNKLYVIGGSDGSHSLNTTEIFDEETQTWSFGPCMTTPRANMEVAVVGDRLYAVGGFSGKTFLNTIEYLDEKSNEWTTFVPKGSCEMLARRKPRSRRNSRKSVSEDKKSISSPPSDIMEINVTNQDKRIEDNL